MDTEIPTIHELRLENDDLRKRLRVGSAYNRSLIEASLDPFVTIGLDGKISDLNAATEAVTGRARAELMGTDFADYFTEPDQARESYRRAFREGSVRDYPLEIRHRDGRRTLVSYNASQFRDEAGAVVGVFAAARDLTALTDEFREQQAELEQHVRDRTMQLVETNKELEAFCYAVSHDLRAPLRGIDGFTQALVEDYADNLDEKGRHWCQRIRAASQRMGQLIDDLLRLSRITRGQLSVGPADMSSIVQRIADDFRKAEPDRQVEFVIAPGVEVTGDAQLLEVVLENLLGNAWKFTSRHERAKIEFGAEERDGTRVFFVRDDGAGFDMIAAGRLFNAFQRLHRSSEFPGNGIGLATVKRIVQRHAGKIWAEAAVEQGATFYFTIAAPCHCLESDLPSHASETALGALPPKVAGDSRGRAEALRVP